MSLNADQRSLRAKIGAHTLHASKDSRDVTRPARQAFLARFEEEVDPLGQLPAEERARRAHHALRAHMAQLSYRASVARTRGQHGSANGRQT